MPFMRHELAFVDTEVNPQSQDIADFGAARMDGAQLHTSSLHEFESFLSGCTALCGHNIIRHDIKYLSQQSHTTPGFWSRFLLIDTLPLSNKPSNSRSSPAQFSPRFPHRTIPPTP